MFFDRQSPTSNAHVPATIFHLPHHPAPLAQLQKPYGIGYCRPAFTVVRQFVLGYVEFPLMMQELAPLQPG